MGLNVVSIDGMLIRRAKSYVLRCFACFKYVLTFSILRFFSSILKLKESCNLNIVFGILKLLFSPAL